MVEPVQILLGLDVGAKRIGVALARSDVRIASPLTTLEQSEHIMDDIKHIVAQEGVTRLVIGLPRGMQGQDTAQTASAKAFASEAGVYTGLLVSMQDEALTSVKAEQELRQRGKQYSKADIDALAATYILEDFLHV